ncbi:hypothetical protein ABIC33_003203 [Variovorax sp. 1140]|uniref:hypothetical protein n=1 Tax=Variovorax atrisoli TaxID=3394203 RepID=UPI00339A01F8
MSEDEASERRLPDAWLYEEESGKAILIESKIAAPVDVGQLRGHMAQANRRGFKDVSLIVLTPRKACPPLPRNCKHVRWPEIYKWAVGEAPTSAWAGMLTQYMEVAERKHLDAEYLVEGTLTMFSGITFSESEPYTYLEAKRLLKLLVDELRHDRRLPERLGADTGADGRPAITGREQDSVWDLIPLKVAAGHAHTSFPHLTLSIERSRVRVQLTLPNGLQTALRQRIYGDPETFCKVVESFGRNAERLILRDSGARPFVEVVQRHYRSQRSVPTVDAAVRADPRTFTGSSSEIKRQAEWINAIYGALSRPKSNLQLGIGFDFLYGKSTTVNTPEFSRTVCNAWLSAQPALDAMGLL